MSKLNKLIQNSQKPKVNIPVWKGPEKDGITFSLLSRFLTCRERFRLLTIHGLTTADAFNAKIEYGSMWHICEEHYSIAREATSSSTKSIIPKESVWEEPLDRYRKVLHTKYPYSRQEIDKWVHICKIQFPIYVGFWLSNQDIVNSRSVLSEYNFKIPYTLPSGTVVLLRGKMDSVDILLEKTKPVGLILQENKTKSEIDRVKIQRQLRFDLQTMMYLTALSELTKSFKDKAPEVITQLRKTNLPIIGVRYNVIKRPLSGGKGSIVRHKATKNKPEETWEDYFERLRIIISDDREEFFARWNIPVSSKDLDTFKSRCLDPLLEAVVNWYNIVVDNLDKPFGEAVNMSGYHWQHPFGVRNILDEGGSSDLDEYLESGSEVGLTRVDNLFPELA